jgi:hypothetical protein
VEACNFEIKMPKKFRPAGEYRHLKVSTLKIKETCGGHVKYCRNNHTAGYEKTASIGFL